MQIVSCRNSRSQNSRRNSRRKEFWCDRTLTLSSIKFSDPKFKRDHKWTQILPKKHTPNTYWKIKRTDQSCRFFMRNFSLFMFLEHTRMDSYKNLIPLKVQILTSNRGKKGIKLAKLCFFLKNTDLKKNWDPEHFKSAKNICQTDLGLLKQTQLMTLH